MNRRELLNFSLWGSAAWLAGAGQSARAAATAATACPGDATPAQFLPRQKPDPVPHQDDLEKYPKCPYCSMDLRLNHRTRMLIHYSNNVPDPTCSIHCAAISLSLNLFLEPKAIWVGDNAADVEPRPLIDANTAIYLVGSDLPGIMTWNSKMAYASSAAALVAQQVHGGQLMDFDQTLKAAYNDMADDLRRMRQGREERIRRTRKQD